MSFYNFKLNDPSSFSTSSSPDSKTPNRFVHKTYEDFQPKSHDNTTNAIPQCQPPSNNFMMGDGRGKFAIQGWKDRNADHSGGDKSRFRLSKTVQGPTIPGIDDQQPPPLWPEPIDVPDEIHSVSITSSLQSITHTYSPVDIGILYSLGSPTSLRLVKLAGQSAWHAQENTDEIFILLRGGINMLYRTRSGEEKVTRVIGGELLRVPMRMEHCVVADEGTEVLLLEGNDVQSSC